MNGKCCVPSDVYCGGSSEVLDTFGRTSRDGPVRPRAGSPGEGRTWHLHEVGVTEFAAVVVGGESRRASFTACSGMRDEGLVGQSVVSAEYDDIGDREIEREDMRNGLQLNIQMYLHTLKSPAENRTWPVWRLPRSAAKSRRSHRGARVDVWRLRIGSGGAVCEHFRPLLCWLITSFTSPNHALKTGPFCWYKFITSTK